MSEPTKSAEDEIAELRQEWDNSIEGTETHRIASTSEPKLTFPSHSKFFIGTAFRNARIVCDVEDKNGTQTIEIPLTMKRLFEIDLGETIGQAIKRARDERLKYDTAKNQT